MPERRKRCAEKKRLVKVPKQCQDSPASVVVTESARASCNGKAKLCLWSPSHDEVMASIESLYADELKPFGRILRKRVAERAAEGDMLGTSTRWVPGSDENLPVVDIKHLLAVCENSDRVKVEPEEGGDWSALFFDRPRAFVDVYSPEDVYSSGMWEVSTAYFQSLTGDDMRLPGGRYSCAQVLQARNLPFLRDRSLGQVCHIVQLAISQKKTLGYLNGAIVPYAESQSMVKEQCAKRAEVCSGTNPIAGDPNVMADWKTARTHVKQILDESAQETSEALGTVPLSNVKRLLRAKFNIELSETKLGHSKLSELLQDPKFSDICTVKLQKHGYIVVQVEAQEKNTVRLSESLHIRSDEEPRRVELYGQQAHPISGFDEPLTLDLDNDGIAPSPEGSAYHAWPCMAHSFGKDMSLVQRTFFHAPPSPLTSPPNTKRRSRSLPKEFGSQRSDMVNVQFDVMPNALRSHEESDDSTVDSASGTGLRYMPPSPELSCDCRHCNLEQAPASTPDRTTVVRSMYKASFYASDDNCQRVHSHKPFLLEEPGTTPALSPWPCLSPSAFMQNGCIGSIELSKVHNTFIHSPVPPPTPSNPSSVQRSRSVPRNWGSSKNVWETTWQALGRGNGRLHIGSEQQPWEIGATPNIPGGWGTTPNIYDWGITPNRSYSLASSPVVIPSPALTASPTHYSMRNLISLSQSLPPSQVMGHWPVTSMEQPPSAIIHLADLVQ
jgi:hypothetical protein